MSRPSFLYIFLTLMIESIPSFFGTFVALLLMKHLGWMV